MRITDLSPIALSPGDASAANATGSCDSGASSDFLALISQITGSIEIPSANAGTPPPKNPLQGPQPLSVLTAELEPAPVLQEAEGQEQTPTVTNVSAQENAQAREPQADPSTKPSDDSQTAELSALIVSQLLVAGTTSPDYQDPTLAPSAVDGSATIASGATGATSSGASGDRTVQGGSFKQQALAGITATGPSSSADSATPAAGAIQEKQPRQLPLANLLANDEPAKITGTNTRATSLPNETCVGPSQKPLPLSEVPAAREMKPAPAMESPVYPVAAADELTEQWIASAPATPKDGAAAQNGAAGRTVMPPQADLLMASFSATARLGAVVQPGADASANSKEPQPPEIRTSADSQSATNAKNTEPSISDAPVDSVQVLASARAQRATGVDGAAPADEDDTDEADSQVPSVNKEGVKPGEQRGSLQGKGQAAQAAPLSESLKPLDRTDSSDGKPSFAQALQNKAADKPAAETDRPMKASGLEAREAAHEGLPGMSAATDLKSVALPRETQTAAPRPNEFVYQLAERIQTQLQAGEGEVRIHLKPENLGNLEIKAESGVGGIVARIATESSSVKQYLEGNLHTLQQSLQEQGLKVDRIDVVLQEALDLRHSSNQQQHSGQTGNGQSGSNSGNGAGGSRSTSSVLDGEIVVDPWIATALGPNSTFHTVA
jgi:flagellar hook-length control protein FliK